MENNLKDQHYKNMGIKPQMETLTFEAESVAYWVAQMIGLDTSEYSFGYISGWSKDKEVSELKEHLELIKETADKISLAIEEKLKEMKTEQEASKVSEQEINYNSSHKARK